MPFRIGHHFASKLTDYGRGRGLRLQEIPYAEAARIYEAQTKQAFPLSQADFAEVISAEYMVYGRKGIGGPQLAEVSRMLSAERGRVAAEFAWLEGPQRPSCARRRGARTGLRRAGRLEFRR